MPESFDVSFRLRLFRLGNPLDLLHLSVHHPHSTPRANPHQHHYQHDQGAESQLHNLAHEALAVDVVDKSQLVCDGVAVRDHSQPVHGVCDQVVQRSHCRVKLVDPTVEGHQLRVEVTVCRVQRSQVVLYRLEQIYSAVSEGDQRLPIVLDLPVGVGVGLSDLHVSHGEVAEGPPVGGEGGQFLIEGNAGDCRGAEANPWRGRCCIDDVGGVGAVDFVPDPDIFGAGGYSSSLVGVEVELGDGIVGVVAAGDDRVSVDVDAQFVLVDSVDPPRDLARGDGGVDIVGADGVGVVVVGLDVGEEVGHGLHFFGDGKLLHGVAVAEEADVETSKHVLSIGVAQFVVGHLDGQHLLEVGAEVVGNGTQRQQVVGEVDEAEVAEAVDGPPQVHHLATRYEFKEMSGGHSQQQDETASQSQPVHCLQHTDALPQTRTEVLLRKTVVLGCDHPQLVVVHHQLSLTSQRICQNRRQRSLQQSCTLCYGVGLVRQLARERHTFLVVLRPRSMSVAMVLLVPLGPIPVLMNRESTTGVGCPALLAVAVESGLGVVSCDNLYLLQMSRAAVLMAFMESTSHWSPGKQICIWVTAALSRLVMFPILFFKVQNPPQVPSPLIVLSSDRQMPQLVISRSFLMLGIREQPTKLMVKIAAAQMATTMVTPRISFLEQGSSSTLRLRQSLGGQLRSKRQQRTRQMKKKEQSTAKIIQGICISFWQLYSYPLLPDTTMVSTRCLWAYVVKAAQTNGPKVDAAVPELSLQAVTLN